MLRNDGRLDGWQFGWPVLLLVLIAFVAVSYLIGDGMDRDFVKGFPFIPQFAGILLILAAAVRLVMQRWQGMPADLMSVVPSSAVALCGALLLGNGGIAGAGLGLGAMGAMALYLAHRGRSDAADE